MPPDQLMREIVVPPPLQGLKDGLDPASPDAIYSPAATPEVVNFRFNRGQWETRMGQVLWKAIGGSGDVRLLDVFYTAAGGRVRLAARGTGAAAQLYDYEEGVDVAFQSVAGGGSLGGTTYPYFQGFVLNDIYYFTDRAGALRKYTVAGGVVPLTQPDAPTVAPGVRPRTYRVLEDWTNVAGWTESDAADYEMTDVTATFPPPGGGRSVKIAIKTTAATGETITENVSGEAINSHMLVVWAFQNRTRYYTELQIGTLTEQDVILPIQTVKNSEWRPFFMALDARPTINYKRFKCIQSDETIDLVLGPLLLPGKLEGQYRWVYTHYNPTTGQESAPGPISNGGLPIDLSAQGVTNNAATQAALMKSAALSFTSDAGVDAATTEVRFYRNGGVPALTKGPDGRDVWYRVGTVKDVSTQLNGPVAAGSTSIIVDSSANIVAGDVLVIDKGTVGAEEFVTVTSVAGTTLNIYGVTGLAHLDNAPVQMAFLDNVANEEIDVLASIQLERDEPPTAARWIARSPDGRIWLFGYTGKPTGVRVSNKSTPERATDYEVFPTGVDPLTRQEILQGWEFEIGGDTTDEEIMWGGFFEGLPTVITRKNVYVINAASQLDWGPQAIQKVLNVGCIAGHTVAEVNGSLYWVADGPRVVRWSGVGRSPEVISYQSINVALHAAPTAYWKNWLATAHSKRNGNYYCLFITPTGATTNILRYDYNSDGEIWEPQQYKGAAGTILGFRGAVVLSGGSDIYELYQVDTDGNIYQAESGLTDAGSAIAITVKTKKLDLDGWSLLHQIYFRLAGVTDTVTLSVTTGGTEYGETTHSYTLTLTGSGDKEIKQRLHRDLIGRWAQFTLQGSVNNCPALRDMRVWFLGHRGSRYGL